MVEQRVTALAQAQVNRIQAQLQAPLQIATSLARVHTLTALTGDDGMPMANLRREELINLARQTLIENPNLTSTYIAWEPNGVDANDLMYRGDEPGMLDGRFASWIYRDGSGQMKIDRLRHRRHQAARHRDTRRRVLPVPARTACRASATRHRMT